MANHKEPGRTTVIDKFNIALGKKIYEFNLSHKPFDIPCARLDFRDKLESAERESQRTHGFVKEDIEIKFDDLDKYGDESRFELLEDQIVQKDILQDGMKVTVVEGHNLMFRCKNRGHGVTVFVPIQDYNKAKTK